MLFAEVAPRPGAALSGLLLVGLGLALAGLAVLVWLGGRPSLRRWRPAVLVATPVVTLLGLTLVLRQTRPPAPGGPSFVGVPLGVEAVDGVDETGFYDRESVAGRPLRWTDGNARLTVPLRAGETPRALAVEFEAHRPAGVRLAVNGRTLFDGPMSAGRLKSTFDLDDFRWDGPAVVELHSDTWVPAAADPASTDRRALGVRVGGVCLLAANDPSPRGPPLGGGPLDPAVVVLDGTPAGFSCGDVTLNGQTLVAADPGGTVRVWNVPAGTLDHTFPKIVPGPVAVAVSMGGDIAVAAADGAVRVWGAHSDAARPKGQVRGPARRSTPCATARTRRPWRPAAARPAGPGRCSCGMSGPGRCGPSCPCRRPSGGWPPPRTTRAWPPSWRTARSG